MPRKKKKDTGVVPGLSYTAEWWIALVVMMLLAGFAIIQVADPTSFNIDPVWHRWIGVFVAMLGLFASVLPRITDKPTNGTPRRRKSDD